MTAYLSFEWLKYSKRWMPRIIPLLLMGLTLVAFWGQSTRIYDQPNLFLPRGWLAALSFSSFFAPFFWPVLGGSWAGNEYGWGTIRTILTRRPERIEHVLAALIVLLAGVAISIVGLLIAGTVAALLVSGLTGNDMFVSSVWSGNFVAVLLKGFLATWYISAFYLILAYAAATIFRSAAVGIGLGIGASMAQIVLTRIFIDLGGIWKDIASHFPYDYSSSMITQVVGGALVPGSNLAERSSNGPSAGASVIALAIYSAIIIAFALVAVRTRDVTS